ncbi:MAG: type VI secretion system protein TssA [Nannocystaceae bacterium]|nr:type VI secretion system protein TssA [Nannocystaceae bacterium]
MAIAEDVQSRASELLAPISDAEPAGQNASEDSRYEEVRNQMASLDSPTGGEVDWEEVAKAAGGLLQTASKDLLVASYFSYAMMKTEGPTGLAVGLATLDGLFETYWDTMFPPARRLRGRGNALGWLTDRLEAALPIMPLQPSDRPAIDLVDSLWKRLGAKSRGKLEDHTPAMGGVESALTRIKLKLPEAPPESSAPPEPSPPAAPTDAGPSGPPPPAPSPAPSQPAAPPEPPAASAPADPPAAPTSPLEAVRTEAEPWVASISDAAPCGEDARYDEAYAEARTEIAQLETPTGGDPDWKKVEQLAGDILKTKAKDLLMASYFAFARYKERGLKALPLGLTVLEQILEQHHEGVFPTRPRGRGNAVGWLVDQLDPALSLEKLQPGDRDTVVLLEKVVKALSTAMRTRLEDNSPPTSPLTDRMTRMLMAVPKPEPKPGRKPEPRPEPKPAAAAAAPPTPAARASAPPMPSTADVGSAEEVNKFLLETGRSLVKAGGLLRRAQPSSPSAYRLVRAGLWLHLHNAPPADAGGKTQIPPLPVNRRQQFQTIAANSKWAALIEETESALGQFRFCLDLNRMTDEALEGLGEAYTPARAALAGEVATLLRRMPELADYTAGDGTPLADDQTKAWLATLNPSEGDGEGGGGGDGADKAAMADVRGQMASKPGDAIKLARERIDEAATPRSRLIRQLILAEICLGTGQPKLARGMFAGLEREMTTRGVLSWEPDLASRCLEGLVRSIRAANKAGAKHEGANEAFEQLCLVDPTAAARLSS